MTDSRTLRRDGDHAVVEQHGRAGFGFLTQSFSLTLAVTEEPMRAIEANALAGDFERFAARYELVPVDAQHTRIVYHATLKPRLGISPLIGVPLMRSTIGTQFDALIAEVQARGARS
jgi:hypothetical protein